MTTLTIALPNPDAVPAELRNRRQWVAWTYKSDGGKLPLDPKTGEPASSTDPSTWADFETAYRYARTRRLGVGYVFTSDDPYCGIDFDDCRSKSTGAIRAETWQMLEALNSYAEVSPSGEGIKVFVKARLAKSHKGAHVEIYNCARVFAVTGQVVPGLPTEINEAQAAVDALVAQHFPCSNGHRAEPICEVIPYGTQHNTLVSLAGRMRAWGLGVEEIEATLQIVNAKRCERPGPPENIAKIAESVCRLYPAGECLMSPTVKLGEKTKNEPRELHHLHIARVCEECEVRSPVDLAALPEPGPFEFVVKDFIPRGYITNLYADSGQGKSYLALHLALCVMTGKPFLGRDVIQGPVLYLDWELDEVSQRRRWGEVTRGQGYEPPPSGLHYVRMIKPLTECLDEIYHWLDEIHPVLVIIDSVGKAVGTDPVDHRAIIAFYSKAETLGTVLAIDHQPKPGGETGYAAKWEFGSSYKRHLARSSWQLERLGTDGDRIGLVLRHKKTNFSALCSDVHATLTFENGLNPKRVRLELAESPAAMGSTFGIRSAILAEVTKSPATAERLAEALPDYDVGSIRNALTALRRAGLIEAIGKDGRAPLYGSSSHSHPYGDVNVKFEQSQSEVHHLHKPRVCEDDEVDRAPLEGEALAGGERLGWPDLPYAQGRRVLAGEDNWRKAIEWAPLYELKLIVEALRRLDKNGDDT